MNRIVLRGARVITMAPDRPDFETVDVVIEDDVIAEICHDAPVRNGHAVDLPGRIVVPGLVNAHLHTWQTGLRSVGADWPLLDYLVRIRVQGAKQFTPSDIRVATLAGALNQIRCGTTTLGDWCHNCATPQHTDAAIDALRSSGIRAVFFHGLPLSPADTRHPREEVERLLKSADLACYPLIDLGMAVNGPHYSTREAVLADFQLATEYGLVISMHESGGPTADSGAWDAVHASGLLGPQTNIVHGMELSDRELERLVELGVTFTCTPENEMGQGHGHPIIGRLLSLGGAPSLGTDVDCVTPGEMLSAARFGLAHQRLLDHLRYREAHGHPRRAPATTSKQALAWATVEGARALGLDERVGVLAPGMQADLLVIDARALNLWPPHDPVSTALQASLANIESVMIAGRWVMRDGELVGVDLESLRRELLQSSTRLLEEMGLPSALSADVRNAQRLGA